MQKYLLRQKSSSVDIFILSNSFTKKVAVPKSNYPKELPILFYLREFPNLFVSQTKKLLKKTKKTASYG